MVTESFKLKAAKSAKKVASKPLRFSVSRYAVSADHVWPVYERSTGEVLLYATSRSMARKLQRKLG